MKKELLITVCAATFFAGTAMAEIASGTEGNISWSISDDGELTISGSGDMSAYAKDKINNKDGNGSVAPWYSYKEKDKKITVSEGITSLGDRAFRGMTNATEVSIPTSVTKIGNTVFEGASSLNNVTIPNSVTSMGDWVFKGATSLTDITLSQNVTSIGKEAFQSTALTSINIPESVTSIGVSAFNGTPLTSVDIPNSVTSIGSNAFSGTQLTELIIPDSVTTIGSHIAPGDLSYHGITNLVIGNGITEIPSGAFWNMSNLKTLILGESLVKIGREAFRNDWSLQDLVFPDSLQIIEYGAFMNFHIGNLTATAEQLQMYIDAQGDFRKNAKIICKSGDCEAVLNNSPYAGKVAIEYAAYEQHNPDGSISVYKDGKLIGLKNKRIYTINEAESLSKETGNKFRIRYK